MNDRDVSGFLSLLLRHHPEVLNITIDEHGWTDVKTLVSALSKNSEFTVEDLERIVRNDSKTRYMFNSDHTLVRAIYGHSIPVTIEYDDLTPPEFLWHGSSRKSTERISQEGLTPQRRNFVHLSYDIETAKKVGRRHGKLVLYKVHAEKMYRDGFRFYGFKDIIWLTDRVPPEYLEIVDHTKKEENS